MPALTFPTLAFLVRRRRAIELACACLGPLAGVYVALRFGLPEFLALGLVAGAVVWLLVRSYLELVTLICDMLLPK